MPTLANYYRPGSLGIPRYVANRVIDKARSVIGGYMKRKATQFWNSGYGRKSLGDLLWYGFLVWLVVTVRLFVSSLRGVASIVEDIAEGIVGLVEI